VFLGYHSNLDEDSTISPTGAQSLSYSRSRLFLPPTPSPATPAPCTAETHHNAGSLRHPPGATEEHLQAQTLSRINSKQYLQLKFSPRPSTPRESVLPRKTAREITQRRGLHSLPEEPPAAGSGGTHPSRRRLPKQSVPRY